MSPYGKIVRVRGQTIALPRVADGVIMRPDVLGRLTGSRPVTVIRAPEGFGKTTLLASWLDAGAAGPGVVAWLHVDRVDGSAERFWADLADRLEQAGVTDGAAADARGAVRRALRRTDVPVVLAVDAFERITAPGLDADLVELVRDASQVRLVVTLRSEAPFARSSWADLGGDEIGAGALALTVAQLAEVLAAHGIVVSDRDATRLHAGIGGWPKAAGLLAAQLRVTDAADVSLALESVRTELRHATLALFDDAQLDALVLPSAVPDTVGAAELRLLDGPPSAPADLDRLAAEGLLFATDDGERRYHWPAVTRELLIAEFARRRPVELRGLHRKLARHYAGAGETAARALTHAAQAADWPQAVRIVERWWAHVLLTDLDVMRRVLADAPPELFTSASATAAREISHPTPEHRAVLLRVALPDSTAAIERLARRDDVQQVVDAGVMVGVALRRRNLLDDANAHFDRLVELLGHARTSHADQVLDRASGVHVQAGITRMIGGSLAAALPLLDAGYRRGGESRFDYELRDPATKSALIEAVRGDTRRASDWLARSHTAPLTRLPVGPYIEGNRCAARALVAVGRLDRAAAEAELPALLGAPDDDELWMFGLHAQARIALLWGDRVGALRLVHERRANPPHVGGHAFADVLLLADEVDLLMATGAASRAVALLDRTDARHPLMATRRARLALYAGDHDSAVEQARVALAAEDGWAGVDTEALLVEALARQAQGDPRAAQALRLAAHRATSAGCSAAFVAVPRAALASLAAAVPEALAVLGSPHLLATPALFPEDLAVVTLTRRERAVLDRLAVGSTMPEIARANFVSINTVKTQARKLYRKLGATDRDAALERARAAGLI